MNLAAIDAMNTARATFPTAVISVVLLTVAVVTLVVRGDDTTLPDVAAPSPSPTLSGEAPTTEPSAANTPGPTSQPDGPTTTPTAPTTEGSAPDDPEGPGAADDLDREPDPSRGDSMPNTGAATLLPGLLLLAAAGGRRGNR